MLAASMAVAVSLFPYASWAKPRVKAERIIAPIAASPGQSCRADFEDEIAGRMAKPNRIREFFSIISEKGLHYNWNFVRMRKEVGEYASGPTRFQRKEDLLLKLAGEIETTYRGSIHDTIMSYVKDSDVENAKAIFSALAGCGYIDRRSMLKQVKTQIALGIGRPDAAAEGEYRGWVITPPAEPAKKQTAESRNQSEIDKLFDTGTKAVNGKK